MSLIPDRYICPRCQGYEIVGPFGRKLSSRCKCDDPKPEDKGDER
jgi:hypothetical protein